MNLRERTQAIFAKVWEQGNSSIRRIAAATGMAKSSVHRHRQAIERRNQYPESPLWEMASGHQWLQRLVWAVVYVFGVKHGIGNDTLSELFHLLHLERHIGVSPSALQGIRVKLEEQILSYHQQQKQQLQQVPTKVEICAGADETFFEQMVLVLLDLSSGYIFVEEQAKDRGYQTWQEMVQQALGSSVEVKYLVSDRAKALVKLALEGLGCRSVPDLFHALRDLGRQIGVHLGRRMSQLEQQLSQATANPIQLQTEHRPTPLQQQKLEQLQAQYSCTQATQTAYHAAMQQLSLCMHPFAIDGSGFQSATAVIASLERQLHTLSTIANASGLSNWQTTADKFTSQIPALAAVVNTWWTWVCHNLSAQQLSPQTSNWLLTRLLPVVYWQQQLHKTKSPALKQAYHSAFTHAHRLYSQDSLTPTFSPQALQHWWTWAEWMVSKFQRTSSPVEGRNGYLSRIHHCGRGLSAHRLQVLTVIHNFALHRADGTTAAQRLFGRQFPDLFEFIVEHMQDLPLPRKSKKSQKSQVPSLPTVPA